jgi:membrane protease subunit (stomatin/prohibitin family)
MGLFDYIKTQFLEIIQWEDDSRDTLSWRFPDEDKEIKRGAQLIVRESQTAQFIYLGQFGDTFAPGKYSLTTDNIPILSTLKGWKYGLESPFKAEVIFVRTTRVTDLRWGTQNPVLLRDEDLGAVRLRAFGTYSAVVRDAARFVQVLVGTDEQLHMDELHEALRSHIVARFSDLVAERKLPLLDLAEEADELGSELEQRVQPSFHEYGLELCDLRIENLSLPPEVEEAPEEELEDEGVEGGVEGGVVGGVVGGVLGGQIGGQIGGTGTEVTSFGEGMTRP